jgi:molybdenum cofactor synthesis domain-containing protein
MKVSLLTIGTEITTGEIMNTNAQWLSTRLEDLGMDVQHHLTVPDQKELMLDALEYLSKTSDLLVVTGGLGPTKDDLTREVMALWAGQELKFFEEIWTQLEKRLQERQVICRPSHKRQCFFPQEATILKNSVGSAQGFEVSKGRVKAVVLPGPPRELKPMWSDVVEPRLPKGDLSPWVRWVFEGLHESDVADRFENVLKDFLDPSQVEIGYRASPPLIHVKMREETVPQGLQEKLEIEFQGHLQKQS